jgi:hypothetical protein
MYTYVSKCKNDKVKEEEEEGVSQNPYPALRHKSE